MTVDKKRAAQRRMDKAQVPATRAGGRNLEVREQRLRELLEEAADHLPALLTVRAVAEFLVMGKRTVHRYIELGELTTVATGVSGSGNVRILKSSLVDLLARQTLERQKAVPHQAKALDRVGGI